MAEFSAKLDGMLELRLKYSIESFPESDMKGFQRSVDVALEGLVDGMEFDRTVS